MNQQATPSRQARRKETREINQNIPLILQNIQQQLSWINHRIDVAFEACRMARLSDDQLKEAEKRIQDIKRAQLLQQPIN